MRLQKPIGTIETLGDENALRTFEFAAGIAKKYARTKKEKELLHFLLPPSNTIKGWYVTQKDFSLFRLAVLRIRRGQSAETVYRAVADRHNLLKTPFLRYLEYCWFKEDETGFLKNMFGSYLEAGGSRNEIKSRAKKYANLLEKEFTKQKK